MTDSTYPILMYHQIGVPAPRGTRSRSLCVSTSDFAAHMRWLKRFGYRGVSMRDLMPYVRGEKQGKVVAITFDDGYRNVHANALPILQDLGFTATNYIVSAQIGGFNSWDAQRGIPRADCMSLQELREWSDAGHEIGAHTVNHVPLASVPLATAATEISDCRRALEDLIGTSVDGFCYPHGDLNAGIRDMVAEVGYAHATTTESRHARRTDDPMLLPRLTVRRGYSWMRVVARTALG